MKSRRKSIAAILCMLIILPLILISVLPGCSCSPEEPPEDATLVSISLDASGAKTAFAYGETFTSAGLKVTANMSDETTKDVPLSDCTFSSPNMTAPGTRSVTVTYQEKTARYEITVAEKYIPAIDGASLVDITGVNEDVGYRVEAEDINMTVSGAVTESGSSFIETAVDTTLVTSGGKYLGNFGVAGNYFGFTFTADKAYDDIILVLRMAYGGTSNLSLGTSMKMYLNYKSMSETGEVDIGSKTIEVGETADECGWQDIVVRNIAVSEGVNTLTFEVLSAAVPNIDYIDFYVGKRYISSVVEISAAQTYMKEFEDFDLEKIVNRDDMIAAHKLQPGQCYTEAAPSEGPNKSSAGGFTTGTEISTTIRTAEDATVNIIMVAACVSSYKIKDAWEFYIDGELLTDIEDKNIQDGSGFWAWKNTDLGKYDLTAGDHLFTAKVIAAGSVNVDLIKFNAVSYGEFAVEAELESIAVTTAPTKTAYVVGNSFDTSGMVVTATYDDETTEAVTGYTVSPSGALAMTDTSVTISYTKGEITKTTTQSITVTEVADPRDSCVVNITGNGTYTMEAEAADLSDASLRSDLIKAGITSWTESVTGEAVGITGGDECLRGLAVGSKITVNVWSELASTVDITFKLSKTIADKVDDCIEFSFNGTVFTLGDSAVFPGSSPTNTYWNWGSFSVTGLTLKEGEVNTLVLETKGEGFNLDTFSFTVPSTPVPGPESVLKSIAVTTAPTKESYTEGDSFNTSGMVVTATYEDETTEAVSGYTVNPSGALALTDTFVTISYTKDGITKTTTQSITVTEKPVATADIEISEVKEYVMEAEDCDLSACIPQSGFSAIKIEGLLTTEPVTSGGYCIEGVGAGSVITVTIAVDADATVEIYARMAKYEGGAASQYASFTFDGAAVDISGETVTTGKGTSNEWYNWTDIYCGTYNITAGEYDFVFTGAINLDCFKFNVTAYGG